MRHDFWDEVGALENVAAANRQQHTRRGTLNQAAGSFQHSYASSLGANQRASDIEAVFRKKKVQVIAGDSARNIRIALTK